MRAIVVLLLILVHAAASEMTPVTVQLRWYHQFQFAGYYAALEKGFYREEGLDVTLMEGGPSVDVVDRVLSGKADFGISNSGLLVDYLNGAPVVMLGAVFQHSPNVLLTRPEFKSPVDLVKHGPVALMEGDQDIELKAVFVREGIDLRKVRFVPNESHMAALIDGRVSAINAYLSNEPFYMRTHHLPYRVIEPRNYGLDFYGDVVFTSRAFLNRSPETVERFRRATMRGWEYAFDHSDELVERILSRYNTQHKSRDHLRYEADALRQLVNPELVQIGHSNPGRWEHIALVYKQFGLIRNARPLKGFFYAPEYRQDMTWYYVYFLAALAAALFLGILAYYIARINRRLRKSVSRHRVLFENSASAGIVWKEDYTITDWNRQAEQLFGWQRKEALGRNLLELLRIEERHAGSFRSVFADTELHLDVFTNLTKEGETLICEWHNTQLPKIDDENVEAVSMVSDVTERQREEERLAHLANHDPLTSLPNRNLFHKLLGKIHAYAKRHGHAFEVAYIDLDGFKEINDTFGHESGDHLLRTLALRFQDSTRHEDIIARLGGDEFVAILTSSGTPRVYEGVLERLLKAAATPVTYHGHELRVTASIGVTLFNEANDVGIEEILRQADAAMYRAKKTGKNRYCYYSPAEASER